MKYLAEGFQYKVYLMEDNRVIKKEISYFIRLYKIFKITHNRGFSFFKSILTAIDSDKKNKKAFKLIREKIKTIPKHLFANPEFIGNTSNFTQDKVVILEDYLKYCSTEDAVKIIDKYIEFQKMLWSHGIHDAVYKFQPNYGTDKEGSVVCVDFGEFVFTKEEALKSIQKEKWLNRSSYKNWEEDGVKKYYTEKMSEIMTQENVDKNWDVLLKNDNI